ncbi:MAG: DUF4956 domain-containing protein [Oscillospiraceae bacterium]|nr:DUF4956 domain-containing protein [Oscillospiraceae bacterium]
MSIKDILKNSFLNQFNTPMDMSRILTSLLCAAALGVYVFVIYRITCRKAFYSKGFAISLVAIDLITAAVIMAVQSSAIISLGMVGALSIVRFRTAIKDPMDLAFLFWVISVGIICGAALYEIAILASLLITVVMLVLHFIPNVRPALLLIVNLENMDAEPALKEVLKKQTSFYKIKSRNVTSTGLDMIVELKTANETDLIKQINLLEQVSTVTLMNHDGEITY